MRSAELSAVLEKMLSPLSLTYVIEDKIIVIIKKSEPVTLSHGVSSKSSLSPEFLSPPPVVRGRVTNENGEGVAGVTISIMVPYSQCESE